MEEDAWRFHIYAILKIIGGSLFDASAFMRSCIMDPTGKENGLKK